jgi:hypothetical protein
MGPLDGYNPNGGGALKRYEEAEERASGTAAYQQLNIALDHMDKTVLSQIRALDDLSRRMAWEASGGGASTALLHGAALEDEKYFTKKKSAEEEGSIKDGPPKRLAKTLARTLKLAEEREQISHPKPISDDVMGEVRSKPKK